MAMIPFNLPNAQSTLVNVKSGVSEKAWYQYFANLFQIFGNGGFGTATQVLHGAGTGFSAVNLAADVTGLLPTANIANLAITTAKVNTNAVTNAKLAQMPTMTLKGNNTGVSADPIDLTVAQVITLLGALITQTTGSWTPSDASGAALIFSGISANYTQIGNMVYAYTQLTYPVTADLSAAKITGLPVTVANANYAQMPGILSDSSGGLPGTAVILPLKATTNASIILEIGGTAVTNAQLSADTIRFMAVYPST